VPTDVEAVVMRCLAKDPDARFPSAGELEAVLSGMERDAQGPLAARTEPQV
jgi:hypothetical protein